MAGTAKVLGEINNTREEISHIVDLLSRRHPTKLDIIQIIKERPLEAAVFAILLGIWAGFFSNKIKSLFKFALLIYTTKQSISYIRKT